MDELDMIYNRHKLRTNNQDEKNSDLKVSMYFSKILISIIFILGSTIYIKINDGNIDNYKRVVFEDNITFAKINNWYQKNFGNIFPSVSGETNLVSSEVAINTYDEKYLDGYKVKLLGSNTINSLASGILVYLDEKEGYGKTAIVQGIDGVDIWYGNITDTNLKLYDYVEKGSVLGTARDSYFYNVFYKSGSLLTYEDYEAKTYN